jgi:hypothetical protein
MILIFFEKFRESKGQNLPLASRYGRHPRIFLTLSNDHPTYHPIPLTYGVREGLFKCQHYGVGEGWPIAERSLIYQQIQKGKTKEIKNYESSFNFMI